MSYENAKATTLLATNCLCCGRPLLDATSVEIGIGPVCREKFGYFDAIPDASRVEANALVHEAAAVMDRDMPRVMVIATRLDELGLATLAGKVRDRFVSIKLIDEVVEGDNGTRLQVVKVFTPYDPGFVDSLKRRVAWNMRRWNREEKCWMVAKDARKGLWDTLTASFPGQWAVGGKGIFQIPQSV